MVMRRKAKAPSENGDATTASSEPMEVGEPSLESSGDGMKAVVAPQKATRGRRRKNPDDSTVPVPPENGNSDAGDAEVEPMEEEEPSHPDASVPPLEPSDNGVTNVEPKKETRGRKKNIPDEAVVGVVPSRVRAGNGTTKTGAAKVESMEVGESLNGSPLTHESSEESVQGDVGPKKARGRKRVNLDGSEVAVHAQNGGSDSGNSLMSAYNLTRFCDPEDAEHKKNCRDKPLCWARLGEKEHLDGKFVQKKKDQLDKKSWYLRLDQRQDLPSIGLMNPSQLCYMSGALQLLFSIPLFRLRLYKWNPAEDATETCLVLSQPRDTSEGPTSFAGILIRTFSFMEHSSRMYIEPKSFVEALRLNPDEQQDPHEFLLLVFESLTRSLSGQSDPQLTDLVKNIFWGCKAVTFKCTTCKVNWPGEDRFFTFTVNLIDDFPKVNPTTGKRQKKEAGSAAESDKKQLVEVIQSAMASEYLTETNCGQCEEKRTVERSYKLKTPLPPVFLIEVTRCAYDNTGSRKKKVRVPLTFDDTLDLSSYVDGTDGPITYGLHGVLLHQGTSADEGHYVLYIKDTATQRWVKYDDACVEFEDHPSFDENKPEKKRKKEIPKTFVSKDCYLLVYVREDEIKAANVANPGSADWALKYVQEDETEARLERKDFEEFKAKVESQLTEKQKIVSDAYHLAQTLSQSGRVKDLSEFEFVSTECYSWWMHEWPEVISTASDWKKMGATGKFRPKPSLDVQSMICPHERLSQSQITHVKCVPERLGSAVREAFDVSWKLKADESICNDCVTSREKIDELRAVLDVEAMELAGALKAGPPPLPEEAFWLGKASSRDWRKIFLSHYEPSESKKSRRESGSPEREDEEEDGFNCDITCPHGNLIIEERPRILVSESVWNRLRSRFPGCPEFPRNTDPCAQCVVERCSLAEEAAKRKDKAKDLKTVIGSIIAKKKCPPAGCDRMLVVPTEFVENLARFIRRPETEPGRVIKMDSILCKHGKLKYGRTSDYLENDVFHLITPEEVEVLKEMYQIEADIWATPPRGWQGGSDLSDWLFDMERCEECWSKEVEETTGEKFAFIFVKRFELCTAALQFIQSKISESGYLDVDGVYEGVQQQDDAVKEELEDVINLLTADLNKARGGRARRATKKGADELSFRVQLKETLDTVQKRVSAKLSIPISEQTLMVGIKRLDGPGLKLVQHGIWGDCRMVVLFDKKIFGSDVTNTGPRAPEKGFEGTKLAN